MGGAPIINATLPERRQGASGSQQSWFPPLRPETLSRLAGRLRPGAQQTDVPELPRAESRPRPRLAV